MAIIAFVVGDRVRVKWECTDHYVQPWRGRFEKGRVGTVIGFRDEGGHWMRVKVRWDHKPSRRMREWEWEIFINPNDLEVV